MRLKKDVVTETLTIVEGSNRWQIREQLEREKWMDGPTFDALCDDQIFEKSEFQVLTVKVLSFLKPINLREVSPKF